ncbi:DUF4468 domain-containing protein [Chitinophaga vietnamensis]|uniref:DUF4468 domain-containing protein n=1 Tax=Chitinophaga vietnamensis TaxID=2593957 RepID=UPI001375D18A|nr:DUF4468 domain-containing protein [Chitinophaga vietnamensis]
MKLFLLLILVPQLLHAQDSLLNIFPAGGGHVQYTSNITVSGASKAELAQRAMQWVLAQNQNLQEMKDVRDASNGILTYKGFFIKPVVVDVYGKNMEDQRTVLYNVGFFITDGRAKVTVNNIRFRSNITGLAVTVTPEYALDEPNMWRVEDIDKLFIGMTKKKAAKQRAINLEYFRSLNQDFIKMLNTIAQALKEG